MKELEIKLTEGNSFRCGDEIKGVVSWALKKRPDTVFIRLFWYTSGKGTRDIGIEKEIKYDMPKTNETKEFRFKAPASPYSFSGRLISIIWAIEASTTRGKVDPALIELEISPTGKEILLDHKED